MEDLNRKERLSKFPLELIHTQGEKVRIWECVENKEWNNTSNQKI